MPRPSRPRWSWRSGLGVTVLVLLVAAGGSVALVKARAGTDPPESPRNSRSAEAVAQAAGKAGDSGWRRPQANRRSAPMGRSSPDVAIVRFAALVQGCPGRGL